MLLKVEVFGEHHLSKVEMERYNDLLGREIDMNIYNKNPVDDLILKF